MSPTSVEEQAVASATTLKEEDSSQFVKEWVRFWFHGLGISLAGLLALTIPDLVALPALISAVLFFAWYEFVRCRPKVMVFLKNGPLRILTSWMPWAVKKIKVRPHEIGTRTSSLDFLLGLTIAWAICPSYILATACFVTAWCDPFARVVGIGIGKHKWASSEKTLEGSLACCFVAALVAMVGLTFLGNMPIELALSGGTITGVIAACVELIPQFPIKKKPGDTLSPADNFSIILSVSIVLSIWHHCFSQIPL